MLLKFFLIFVITLIHRSEGTDDQYAERVLDSEEHQYVTCGSVVKLQHVDSSFRLHSHQVTYGTGSGQQSVTGFPKADDNNSYWIVKGPHGKDCSLGKPIKKSETLRLEHQATGKHLHSHLHQSPLSKQQEVSCYGNEDSGDNWKIIPSDGKEDYWVRNSEVRLQHVDTNLYLQMTNFAFQNPIPGQREVVCSSQKSSSTVWKTAEGLYFPVLKSVSTEAATSPLSESLSLSVTSIPSNTKRPISASESTRIKSPPSAKLKRKGSEGNEKRVVIDSNLKLSLNESSEDEANTIKDSGKLKIDSASSPSRPHTARTRKVEHFGTEKNIKIMKRRSMDFGRKLKTKEKKMKSVIPNTHSEAGNLKSVGSEYSLDDKATRKQLKLSIPSETSKSEKLEKKIKSIKSKKGNLPTDIRGSNSGSYEITKEESQIIKCYNTFKDTITPTKNKEIREQISNVLSSMVNIQDNDVGLSKWILLSNIVSELATANINDLTIEKAKHTNFGTLLQQYLDKEVTHATEETKSLEELIKSAGELPSGWQRNLSEGLIVMEEEKKESGLLNVELTTDEVRFLNELRVGNAISNGETTPMRKSLSTYVVSPKELEDTPEFRFVKNGFENAKRTILETLEEERRLKAHIELRNEELELELKAKEEIIEKLTHDLNKYEGRARKIESKKKKIDEEKDLIKKERKKLELNKKHIESARKKMNKNDFGTWRSDRRKNYMSEKEFIEEEKKILEESLEKMRSNISVERAVLEQESERLASKKIKLLTESAVLDAESEKLEEKRIKIKSKVMLVEEQSRDLKEKKDKFIQDRLELVKEDMKLEKLRENVERKKIQFKTEQEEIEEKKLNLEIEAEILADMTEQLAVKRKELEQELDEI